MGYEVKITVVKREAMSGIWQNAFLPVRKRENVRFFMMVRNFWLQKRITTIFHTKIIFALLRGMCSKSKFTRHCKVGIFIGLVG